MHRFPYPKACEEIIAIHQFAVDYELESGIPTEQECEQCGAKMLLIKEFESLFMRCENYPQCSNYRKFEDGERVKTYITCPGRDNESCRKPMIAIRGRSNLYLQCTDPQCNTRKVLC
jgi:ssDNA-binding Zn-finger/Zn-ribbon topoisomerase 1